MGSQQSPIRIGVGDVIEARLPPLEIAWARQADTIVNNGHTIQLNFGDGGTLSVGSERYTLVQFHFHKPGEHFTNIGPYAMEAHFVHRNAAGSYGVIGVFIRVDFDPNPVFAKVVATMPRAEGPPVRAAPGIDPNGLLPSKLRYYRYAGSLTTPPCGETVDWMLLTDPIVVHYEDYQAFGKLYPMNARMPMPLNRRFVLRSE